MLAFEFFTDDLGADPVEHITHVTGEWTLRFLLVALAITPARRLAGVLGVVHFIWLVKADLLEPLVYVAVLSVLFGTRIWLKPTRSATGKSTTSPTSA
jgi:sulfoxide reductase heme-binding subunit YedZ